MALDPLPGTPGDWVKVAGSLQPELYKGLRALQHSSASKISKPDYFLLRTLWSSYDFNQLDLTKFIKPKPERSAETRLPVDQPFQNYLAMLEQRVQNRQISYDGRGGIFDLVLYQQEQIQRIPKNETSNAMPKLNISPRIQTRSVTRRMNRQIQANRQSPSQSRHPRVGDIQPGSLFTDSSHDPSRTEDLGEAVSTFEPPGSSIREADTSSEKGSNSTQSDTSSPTKPHSPSDPASVQAACDEQIVNAGLMSLLAALTMYCSPNAVWTMERKSFRMRDLYEARTDGYLYHRSSTTPLAILETKAHVRKAKPDDIMMQETAQMAAWIRFQPASGVFANVVGKVKKHRLLISQDHNEIYLTIAEYDNEYERYLHETSEPDYKPADELQEWPNSPHSNLSEDKTRNKRQTSYKFHTDRRGPFLHMRCYGPWNVREKGDMRDFAQKIIALTQLLISGHSDKVKER